MSYMLFFPGDEEMLENIKYYKALPKAKPEFFHPREVHSLNPYKFES